MKTNIPVTFGKAGVGSFKRHYVWSGESWCDENWHGWMLDVLFFEVACVVWCGMALW